MTKAKKVSVANVMLWGRYAGAVAWDEERQIASFEYDDKFIQSGQDVSPLRMPLRKGVFSFNALKRETYHGLPGLLADSLPDRFGNRLIDIWLQRNGRSMEDFSPVERLCYIGKRGMGALEFEPAMERRQQKSIPLEISELTELAREILSQRSNLLVNLDKDKSEAIDTIIRVGTSAGGNRAKAIIAWNPKTHEVRSGQVPAPAGFEPWILKFDGVADATLGDPVGFGRAEFAYHRMAAAAGIEMSECHLMKDEKGNAHFMTKRFDRGNEGGKIHMQSLCALAHYDFNASGEYGYEQAMSIINQLNLGYPAMEEIFRRMVFNVIARNQDDHTRNIAFLMGEDGKWRLSPAFDLVWSYNPEGNWTHRHQMSINGKRDNFVHSDLTAVAEQFGIKKADEIIVKVTDAVARWPEFARESNVGNTLAKKIGQTHRAFD